MEQNAKALARTWGAYIAMAGTITLTNPLAVLAASPVNTMNDGRIVQDGTYFNTPDGVTTFTNSGTGGLWVRGNTTIRGLEVDNNGALTNNGGNLHFWAPGSVVRVDGNINVSGVLNGQGTYLGNGGRVFIDSAYLYQGGHIYANGNNGGLVQMNVGSATFAPGSSVEAKGFGGNGGVIAINSDGLVNISSQALLDSSGRVAGSFDSNLINIEGGTIYNAGILRADGVVAAQATAGSRGGTIRLVATGNTNLNQVNAALDDATKVPTTDPVKTATVSTTEAQQWKTSIAGRTAMDDGDIVIDAQPSTIGTLSAVGSRGLIADNNDTIQDSTSRAGDGGTISLTAMGSVLNKGTVTVSGGDGLFGTVSNNGGNGGTIAVIAKDNIFNGSIPQAGYRAHFLANGGRGGRALGSGSLLQNASNGGTGGLMAFGYNGQMLNSGVVQATGGAGGAALATTGGNGGQGGLLVLSGNANPTGNGYLDANGGRGGDGLPGGSGGMAGTIVSPIPGTLRNTQIAFQVNGGNGTTLGQPAPAQFGAARPLTQQTSENELLTHGENLILLTRNVTNGLRAAELSQRAESATMRSVRDPNGTGAAAQEILRKDAMDSKLPYRNFIIGSSADTLRINLNRQPVFMIQGSEVDLSKLNTLTVFNDGYTTNTFEWDTGHSDTITGGRISLLATGDIENGTGLSTIGQIAGGSINLASKGNINNFDILFTSDFNDGKGIHGGSIMLNAVKNITNYGFRPINSSGGLIGGTQRYNANGNIMNLGDFMAIAYGTTQNIPQIGGNINIRAGQQFTNGNEVFNPCTIQASAVANNQGYGGFISLRAQTIDDGFGTTEVNGSLKNGTVVSSSP